MMCNSSFKYSMSQLGHIEEQGTVEWFQQHEAQTMDSPLQQLH